MLRDLFLRLRSLFRRDLVEHELDDELRFHLEQQVASYERQGLAPADARRRARLEFGGLAQIREEHRDARGIQVIDDLGRDVRYAVRQLRRSPSFALVSLLCLAVGIGATTAVVSVVNAVLLRPLPFSDSDRFVRIDEHIPPRVAGRPPGRRAHTYQQFLGWRSQSKTLSEGVAMGGVAQRLVRTPQGVVGLWGTATTTNTFRVFGVPALIGRTFSELDDANPDVVVLSFDTWRRYFNADPTVVGRILEFRGGALIGPVQPRLMTVIGVLPANVQPNGAFEFYWPLVGNLTRVPVAMIFRLATGVSLEAAAEEANVIGTALSPPLPANAAPLTVPRFEVQRLKDLSVGHVRPPLRVFVAAVVLVLMIVCGNVANLLLARGTARQREIAVRFAIGASRGRVVRQIMTESLVLAFCGGALGALLATGGIALLKHLTTVEAPGIYRLMFGSILPRVDEIGVDLTVLGIAFSLAAITSVAFGILPALTLSRGQGGTTRLRSHSAKRGESRLRAALVVGQLVMATVLLVGAGLLAHSFARLAMVNNGYDPANVLAFNLLFPDQYSVPQKAETIDALLERFRNTPDVRAAGFSRHGLLIGEELFIGPWVPHGRAPADVRNLRTRVRSVSEGYLTAMGVPLLEGREFDTRDRPTAPTVIVMSRSAASQYFGDASPVGEVLDWEFAEGHQQPVTVVGVVEDIRQESPTDDVFPEIFVNYRQFLFLLDRAKQPAQRHNELAIGFLSFALRTSSDPAATVPQVREIVRAVDPNVGIDAIVPMTQLTASAVANQRFYAVAFGVFAAVAAVIAAIGIYGVLTYAVVQRTQEIGIRIAIGAQRPEVLALVLRQGLGLVIAGIGVGLVGSAAATRLLEGMLFGVTPLDARTFIAVALLFGLVAAAASYLPARRATRVDALVAIRSE